MAGIVFYKTTELAKIVEFYQKKLGFKVWLDQGSCIILAEGDFKIGFCEKAVNLFNGIITLYYPSKEEVDHKYEELKDIAETEPMLNEKFDIYQFFAKDPEGRGLEFQTFLHRLPEE